MSREIEKEDICRLFLQNLHLTNLIMKDGTTTMSMIIKLEKIHINIVIKQEPHYYTYPKVSTKISFDKYTLGMKQFSVDLSEFDSILKRVMDLKQIPTDSYDEIILKALKETKQTHN